MSHLDICKKKSLNFCLSQSPPNEQTDPPWNKLAWPSRVASIRPSWTTIYKRQFDSFGRSSFDITISTFEPYEEEQGAKFKGDKIKVKRREKYYCLTEFSDLPQLTRVNKDGNFFVL